MESIAPPTVVPPFLHNSGDMGEHILKYNWAQNSLGPIHRWPQSLCTTLGIMLHSAFPMFLFWSNELVCFYNDAFRPCLATDGKHPAIGKNGKEVWSEVWPFIGPLIEGVMKTGTPVWFENQVLPFYRNGGMGDIYWTFSYSPAYGDEVKINGVLVTCVETTKIGTERKKIEEIEERSRLAINAAELGTFDLNLLTNEVVASERFAAIFGLAHSISQADYVNTIHPDDLVIREKAYQQAYNTGSLEYEARVIWNDKSLHWIKVKGNIYFDDKGKPLKLLGVVQDISAEKFFSERLEKKVKERTEELETAHQSLLQANSYLQHIINLSPEPMQVLEPVFENGELIDFRYKITNNAYAAYANTTPEKLRGKKVGEVFPGYFQTSSFLNIVRTYQSGITDSWEIHYNLDGLDIYNQMSATKFNDDVIVHFTDFTRLKNLELNLVEKLAELERSNANLEEFAHAASHDLKEPIRKIHIFTSKLKSQLHAQLTETDLENFSKIERASQRMGSLVDDLLDYSHVSQQPHQMEPVNLNEKINRVLEDLELDIQQRSGTIHIDNLPVVTGFRRQLQQLFQNLISNALKYSKSGIPPQIHISASLVNEDGKQYHLIKVADNGIGFDAIYSEKIFQIFSRLHNNSEYSGSGIGLSIVKKIVENHQGRIRAESEEGKGSTFFVYLPVK